MAEQHDTDVSSIDVDVDGVKTVAKTIGDNGDAIDPDRRRAFDLVARLSKTAPLPAAVKDAATGTITSAGRSYAVRIQRRSALTGGAWQLWKAVVWPAREVRRWHEEYTETLCLRSASHSERRDLYVIGVTLPPPSDLPPL